MGCFMTVSIISYQTRKLSDGLAHAGEKTTTIDTRTARYLVNRKLAEYVPIGIDESKNRIDQICDAIEKLDPDNSEQWTNSGKPQVREVEAILGFDISAAERDQAWEQFDHE